MCAYIYIYVCVCVCVHASVCVHVFMFRYYVCVSVCLLACILLVVHITDHFHIDHSHKRGVTLVRVSPHADWYVSLGLPFNRGKCTVISLDKY